MGLVRAGRPLHQQVERRLGRLELVAVVLLVDHLLQHLAPSASLSACRSFLAVSGDDVRPARELAHQHAALVADRFRLDVLVALRGPVHGVDVHPALVGKRAWADERLVVAEVHVGDFVHVARKLGEMLDAAPPSTS